MASVKKRPDGQWRARYRDESGKEHSKHFTRKADADRWVTAQQADVDRGLWVDPANGKTTVATYAAKWLDAQPIRPSSRRAYDSYLRNRILPVLGYKPLAAVTPTDVRALVKALSATHANNTVRQVHRILAGVFGDAVADGYLAKSPCVRTAPRRDPRPKIVPLTVEEVHRLMEAMPERYRALVPLGAGCGLRVGEALGLKAGRVRFLQRELDVVEQLVLVPGAPPHLAPPKTRSSVRTVPLPDVVAEALSRHLALYPAEPDQLVFRSRVDGPIWPNTFWGSVWQPAVARVGLPATTRYHDLRHFLASALIASGQSVTTVQAVLGHADATTTLGTYAHMWPDSEDRARAAVDDVLGAPADRLRTRRNA